MPGSTIIAIGFGPPVQFQGCVHVSETASGAWIVRDEADSRGGHFRSREAALSFVRREFGPNVYVNVRPLPPAPPA